MGRSVNLAQPIPADSQRVLSAVMAILEQREPEGVIQEALRSARELTGARYAAIGILADDRKSLSRFITSGIDAATERSIGDRPRGRGVLGLLISDPRPIRLSKIGDHPSSYGFPLNHPPMHTFLGVPLINEGRPWGSFYLAEKDSGQQFTDDDESNLVSLARATVRAAVLADEHFQTRARLTELQRKAEALTASMDLARALGGEPDVTHITELIVKRARALTGAEGAVLGLMQGDTVTRVGVAGNLAGTLVGESVSIGGSSLVEGILRSGIPTRIARDSPEGKKIQKRFGATASILAPLTLRNQALGLILCVNCHDDGPEFSAHDAVLLEAFSASAAVALGTARSAEAQAIKRAIATSERERAHWARELHDQTLQELAAIKLLCGLAARASDADERSTLLQQATEQLDIAATDLRSLVTDLRPATLDALGLQSALELLVERLNQRADGDITFASDLALERMPTEIESVVYRVVQEALNNALQHGGARAIGVEVAEHGSTIVASIVDDGSGFDPGTVRDGFGLIGMHERAELVDGELTIESSRGAGTRITLTVPVLLRPTEV